MLPAADDKDIRAYLIKKYRNISNTVINCVITQIIIMQQVRNFKSIDDIFEAVDECCFQYLEICP